jgi:C4-dicarboxylate-specific signal transduction histidine kinase
VSAGPSRRAAPRAADPLVVLETLPVPIMVVDAEGRVLHASAAMRSRARAGAAGADFAALFPDYHAALGGDLGVARDVPVVRRTEDAVAHERITAQPTRWGTVLAATDEPPPSAAQALQDMQTTRLASLGFMVAGVCHEVSNPLAAIDSMVQILRSPRGASPEMLERGLASISSNIARVLAITRTLTDFSRVRAGERKTVALAQVVEDTASLFRHRAGAPGVAVEAAIAPGLAALAEPSQLEQVVFNVLLNAAQAMGGQGRVTVTGERRSDRAVLAIRDEGPGIAPEHLGRIFEPFFTTKPEGAGTGLGLTISREIVHELGGELRAENHPGGGARFVIELPAAAPGGAR